MKDKFGRRLKPSGAIFWWLMAIGWLGMMFYFAGQSGTESSDLSMRITRWLLRHMPQITMDENFAEFLVRKTAHFGIFVAEGFMMRVAFHNTLPSAFAGTAISTALCAAISVLNELYQLTALGRSCSVRDMVIDFAGSVVGILLAALLCYIAQSAYVRRRFLRLQRGGDGRA